MNTDNLKNETPTDAKSMLATVQSIYDSHKIKLNNLKENRSKSDEEKWSDAEIKSVDDQITVLSSVLRDLYWNVLHCY